MSIELIEKNIVILGNFKPNIFDKFFFIKNELAKEIDFTEKSFFLSELSVLETDEFVVNISQNRIIINTKNNNKNNNIQKIAATILKNSDVEVNVIGYNFKWLLFVNQDLNSFSKGLFFAEKNETINKYFETSETVYGYYVLRDYEYSRMNLDIKPLLVQKILTNEKLEVLTFDFNFHIENKFLREELIEKVLDYENFTSIAKKIVSEYE